MKDYVTAQERLYFPSKIIENICVAVFFVAAIALIYVCIYEATL